MVEFVSFAKVKIYVCSKRGLKLPMEIETVEIQLAGASIMITKRKKWKRMT